MATQMNGTATPHALYTVEQLELIRRLRNSGISREDVANAFDTFDRLDRELGPVYNIPVTLALQAQALQLMALGVANANAQNVVPAMTTNVLPPLMNTLLPVVSSQCNVIKPVTLTSTSFVQSVTPSDEPPSTTVTSLNTVDTTQSGITNGMDASQSSGSMHQKLIEQLANSVTKNGNSQESDCNNDELIEFMRKGEAACCEEIKAFAIKHNIKQQQIAVLAGICQSYVSRYMKGDIFDMSERSRRAILKWYLIYRKNPAAIAVAANAATLIMQSSSTTNGGQPPVKKLFLTPSTLDFAEIASNAAAAGDLNFPRRERFVFRPSHLEILEKYFQDNNYPSYETREEIAVSCNNLSEQAAGRTLTDREKVTVSIISNWFANKRKELKKLAREEGLMDVGMVTTRPRGHPSRLYSDLALIQQYRTGVQSSSQSADAAVTSSSVERSPNSMSPQEAGSESDEQQHRDERKNSVIGEDSMQEDDDPSLTWSSVEMAAVNQAILSLTGQQPIDITAGITLPPAAFTATSLNHNIKIESNGCHDDRLNTPPPPSSNADML